MKITIIKPTAHIELHTNWYRINIADIVVIDLDEMIGDLWCHNCKSNSGIHYANHIYLQSKLEGK